jgi:hypothetical protein
MASGRTVPRKGTPPWGRDIPYTERSDTMSKSKSYKENLVDWQTLVDNLSPHLGDLPQVAADQKMLADLVTQAHALQDQRDAIKASLQDLNKQRLGLAAQAKRAQTRIASSLRGAFDPDSEKLVAFGVKPRRKTVRRSHAAKLESAQKAAARAAARAAELEAEKSPPAVKA